MAEDNANNQDGKTENWVLRMRIHRTVSSYVFVILFCIAVMGYGNLSFVINFILAFSVLALLLILPYHHIVILAGEAN